MDKFDDIQPDDAMNINRSGLPYIYYKAGGETIDLDGDFTIEQLEFLIAHMKANIKQTACKHRHTSIYAADGSTMCHDCGNEVIPPPHKLKF